MVSVLNELKTHTTIYIFHPSNLSNLTTFLEEQHLKLAIPAGFDYGLKSEIMGLITVNENAEVGLTDIGLQNTKLTLGKSFSTGSIGMIKGYSASNIIDLKDDSTSGLVRIDHLLLYESSGGIVRSIIIAMIFMLGMLLF